MNADREAPRADFSDVKVGDEVTRLLAGELPNRLKVKAVTETLIECEVPGFPSAPGWTFDRKTGIEEDDELGWGVKYGRTGSYLVKGNA